MYKFLLIAILCLFVACEQVLLQPEPGDDPESLFTEAWTFVDREYAFFKFKNIDWDAEYDRYKSRIRPDMSEEELFQVLADLLFVLRDGHVNLESPFDRSRNWEWYLNSPENFNYSLLERNYFLGEEQFVGPLVVKDFGDVGYVYYGSFLRTVEDRHIDYVVDRFQDKKGLIFDIRNNGGGSVSNVDVLTSRFTTREAVVAKIRYKNGPEHEDFTPFFGLKVKPEGSQAFTKPIILLTNRKSYSASNRFTQYMQELPQVTVVGDTTGGGGGAPAFTHLANGWLLRVSATQQFTLKDFNVEDGIPPDIQVSLPPRDEIRGVDSILERALAELRK